MQPHPTWKAHLGTDEPDKVFRHLMSTLSKGITTYAYFVDWAKVDRLHKSVEVELNILNTLVGKSDPAKGLDELLRKYPEVAKAFPCLLAIRHEPKDILRILVSYKGGELRYEEFLLDGRKNLTDADRAKLVAFARDSGILDLFSKRVTNSIPDYTRGVEVGLDSNGRKNRGGTLMEDVTWEMVQEICKRRQWQCSQQSNPAQLKALWGVTVPRTHTASEPDIAVWTGKKLWLIETNFYNAGGSKLKATAGEYNAKFPSYTAAGIGAIWVTDGMGWLTAEAPLHESFDLLPFVMNLEMCGRGCLEDILAS